ncbi:MAG: DUF4446 family protein [Patescibacteria group bacterium]|jgi:hypothetical protein|nr:DUF4446 family protein [Patescibacteria group bacterium]
MENQNIVYILGGGIGILLVWIIFMQVKIFQIQKKQTVLFKGKDGKDLEKIVLENNRKTEKLDEEVHDLYEITSQIQSLALKGLHKTGFVRFNPFRDIGGDQSFSVALLDGESSGLILSSLYSRDGVRIYAKSIQKGESIKYPLTEEEKQAIKMASIEKDNQKIKKNL